MMDTMAKARGPYKKHPLPLTELLEDKFTVDNGCWEWTGYRMHSGYGQVGIGGAHLYAHRAVWEMLRGPIPEGQTIDHLCRNRGCVNPGHMEIVTSRENTIRGVEARGGYKQNGNAIRGRRWYERHRRVR